MQKALSWGVWRKVNEQNKANTVVMKFYVQYLNQKYVDRKTGELSDKYFKTHHLLLKYLWKNKSYVYCNNFRDITYLLV